MWTKKWGWSRENCFTHNNSDFDLALRDTQLFSVHCLFVSFFLGVIFWALIPFLAGAKHLTKQHLMEASKESYQIAITTRLQMEAQGLREVEEWVLAP